MDHTVDKIPNTKNDQKYSWQKDHSENRTGTKNRHKPVKIKKNLKEKKYDSWK